MPPITLPAELEREIFELAFRDFPEDQISMMLVAARVHTWCVDSMVTKCHDTLTSAEFPGSRNFPVGFWCCPVRKYGNVFDSETF